MSDANGETDLEARVAALEAQLAEQNAELEQSREEAATAGIRLLDALESLSEGFVLVNADHVVSVSNERMRDLFGEDAELWGPGAVVTDIAGALGDRGYVTEAYAARLPVEDAFRRLLADGARSALLMSRGELYVAVNGRPTFDGGCVVTFTDMSSVKSQQRALKSQSQLLQATVDAIDEGIVAFSASGLLVAWNTRLCDVLRLPGNALDHGLSHDGFLRLLAESGHLGEGDPEQLAAQRRADLRTGKLLRSREVVAAGRHIDMSEFAMPDGGHVATFTDMTDRRQAEQLLFEQATTDELTGLPNRVVGIDRLHAAVSLAKRTGQTVGVLFVDLDGFKRVNDTLGHAAGDALLKEAAGRMESCLRASDTIARLGGDEFLVLIPQIARKSECVGVAEKVINRLVEPFHLDGQDIFISCSIGISHFESEGDSAESLLRNADIAMYEAKAAGKNTFHYHSPRLNEEARRRLEIETAFRRAIDNDELYLDYQPIVDATDGRLIGAEALLRWNRENVGLVGPDQFIPIIETTNLIVPTGEWVLRQACRDAAHWVSATGQRLLVAVNVSARQFRDPAFVEKVKDILEDERLPPTSLRIELTETLLVQDPPRARQVLNSLKAINVGIAMDDFGTGYSSLGYIKDFPFDTIKLDKSFVSGILTSHEDRAITRAVLAMADNLKLNSVAEGVETEEQLDFLRGYGCTYAQGFLFGKPNSSELLLQRAGEAGPGLASAAS